MKPYYSDAKNAKNTDKYLSHSRLFWWFVLAQEICLRKGKKKEKKEKKGDGNEMKEEVDKAVEKEEAENGEGEVEGE